MMDLRQQLAARVIDSAFWDVVKRYPVRRRLSEFRAAQWDDPTALEARRDRRLSALLRHAVVRVPFYRERPRGLSSDSIDRDPPGALKTFPILERADLHDHFDGHLIGVEYNNGAIRRFHVVQEAPDKIVVRVVPVEGAEECVLANRDEIAGHITDRMGGPCSVEFAVESDIEPARTGKHLYTVSTVSRA